MHTYQAEFIAFALKHKVLRFGQFKLKSGRLSPYFFNAGLFNNGLALAKLGRFYAEAIITSSVKFELLFGPAYKGIPLAATTAIALADQHNTPVFYSFNRKQVKDHGEGGVIVGAPLEGRVLIVDDVITAGTAIRASAKMILQSGASLAGVMLAFNRKEKGPNGLSAIEEIEQQFAIPVHSLIGLEHVIDYLREAGSTSQLQQIQAYRARYGI